MIPIMYEFLNIEIMKTFYEPTKNGLERLFVENQQLAEVSRTIVMWYLKDDFGRTEERMNIALDEAIVWMEYKRKHQSLFEKFKNDLVAIGYDEDDEHGLADETVKVANLLLNYTELKKSIKKSMIFG